MTLMCIVCGAVRPILRIPAAAPSRESVERWNNAFERFRKPAAEG